MHTGLMELGMPLPKNFEQITQNKLRQRKLKYLERTVNLDLDSYWASDGPGSDSSIIQDNHRADQDLTQMSGRGSRNTRNRH